MSATPLVDYLTAALDRKLAALHGDHAKVQFLAATYGNWTLSFHKFMATGRSPLPPHPTLGALDMFDYRLLLIEIDARRHQLDLVAA